MIRLLFLTSVPLLLAGGLLLSGAINPPQPQAQILKGVILDCTTWQASDRGTHWTIICNP